MFLEMQRSSEKESREILQQVSHGWKWWISDMPTSWTLLPDTRPDGRWVEIIAVWAAESSSLGYRGEVCSCQTNVTLSEEVKCVVAKLM